ncbi:glutelin type-D 1-like [Diospyros lotus]|uniref:glutelin type-D 1-like n=1 Tax=Diospyros lotus TaxID=55363 RepID=UPI0022553696|nr:glutelin type-D 1-like [Diospyros lotus]
MEVTTMKEKLSPQAADSKIFEGDGGSYHSWSTSNFPLLAHSKVGAGKLLLHPRGFALPHYSDSSKIGYVLQGSCTVGIISPGTSREQVLTIEKGDAVPVPVGVVSWWFNGGDSDVDIVFIGETSKAYVPGEFTYFFLTGKVGLLGGFSNEFIRRAYNGITKEEASKLVTSQTGTLVVRLDEGISMPNIPQPCNHHHKKQLIISNSSLTAAANANYSTFEEVALSAKLVKLEPEGEAAVLPPTYAADSAVQVSYVVKGSGRVQLVGINGKQELDAQVKAGDLLVIPPFYAAMEIADHEQGVECLSVITSSQPKFGQLGGKTSVWKAMYPGALQASLGTSPEFAQLVVSKMTSNTPL